MKLFRKIAVTAAAVALTASVAAPSAQAGALWLYKDSNYRGWIGKFWNPVERKSVSAGNNDRMSSWSNGTRWNGAWYEHGKFGGKCHNMPAYSSNRYVGWWDNDTMSSFRLGRGC